MKIRKNGKGFTLVELLLVMAIIGILAGIIFISIGSARKRARITTFKESMKNLAVAATQCTDIEGSINAVVADGTTGALCDTGNIGDVPVIKDCDGTANSYVSIIATPGGALTGDDFSFTSVCTVSTSADCTAVCTSNGCTFDDSQDATSTNDNCPNT